MAMSRTLRLGLLFALICTAVASCISPPDFPDTPSIKFKELEVVRLPPAFPGDAPADSDTITISFEDGDGDLGLSPEDLDPPYNSVPGPGGTQLNPNYFNYYIQPQIKDPVTGEFVDFSNSFAGEYNARFPRLGPESGKEAPLKGDLRLAQRWTLNAPFKAGDEIRFKVSIRDRALNLSNEVLTSSYVVKGR